MILVRINRLNRKGMAIYPFVFVRDIKSKNDPVLINHERIHLRQQLELLILPFFLLYFINYLYNLVSSPDHETAYRNIIFEKEAYDHENDPGYLKTRRFLGFLDYL